jgi:hypothetical protein
VEPLYHPETIAGIPKNARAHSRSARTTAQK